MSECPDYHSSFEPLLDSEHAAALVKVHPKTLQRHARHGLVPGLHVGKLWRFRASDLLPPSSEDEHRGAAEEPVPLDSRLAEALWHWRTICVYPRPEDWVFASPHTNGEQPYWPGTLNRWHLQPAVKAAGIQGRIGWHTFRRTYATLLKANGEDVKAVQELLRHANSLVTMNLYAQAVTEVKRNAQSRLVGMLFDGKEDKRSAALIGTKRTYEKIIQSRKLLN